MSEEVAPSKRTTPKKPPADRIIQEILGGRCDDRIYDIATAGAMRLKEIGATLSWRFVPLNVGEHDLTPSEWEAIESLTEVPWTFTNPDPKNRGTMRHSRVVATVLQQRRGGMSALEAVEWFEGLGIDELEVLFVGEQRPAPLSSPN